MRSLPRLILLVVVVAAAAFGLFYFLLPYGPAAETFVDIPQGASSSTIAQKLESAGLLRSRYAFLAIRRVHGGTLHAGEYRFDHPLVPGDIYRRLVKGDTYTRTLTIPEGYNLYDIAAAVEAAGLGNAQDFLAAARRDTGLVADLDAAHPPASLEGYLFPDTYKFSPHATPDQMLAVMVKRFKQEAVKLGLLAPNGFIGDRVDYGVRRVVTMASLVEKEVRNASERPIVAGVFENRLARSMPLQTDPSVMYAALLDGRWRGTIYQSDLASESPYNTYRHVGLPPGPIASPGVAALRAAMHPAQTDYLYFVADAQGNTRFSVDLAEHARQVAEYRAAHGR